MLKGEVDRFRLTSLLNFTEGKSSATKRCGRAAIATPPCNTKTYCNHAKVFTWCQKMVDVLQTFSPVCVAFDAVHIRSEEHTSELQSLMRISYAVFCLKKKKNIINHQYHTRIITN